MTLGGEDSADPPHVDVDPGSRRRKSPSFEKGGRAPDAQGRRLSVGVEKGAALGRRKAGGSCQKNESLSRRLRAAVVLEAKRRFRRREKKSALSELPDEDDQLGEGKNPLRERTLRPNAHKESSQRKRRDRQCRARHSEHEGPPRGPEGKRRFESREKC